MIFLNSRFITHSIARTSLFALLLFQFGQATAISTGQLDDFQDGTRQGWSMGQPDITSSQMTNEANGGPAGVGDRFLQVTGTGTNDKGGRPTFFNKNLQWSGDYSGAGITAIAMDLKNFSSAAPLNIRLAINGGFFDPNNPGVFIGGLFATLASIELNSGSDWTHVVFSLTAGDLTPVSGNAGSTGNNVAETLANVTELRIISSAAPAWHGDPVAATLGIDNIMAVPLPPAALLFASGLLALGMRRRRRV